MLLQEQLIYLSGARSYSGYIVTHLREKIVTFSAASSDYAFIKAGVPQGSVLGPSGTDSESDI